MCSVTEGTFRGYVSRGAAPAQDGWVGFGRPGWTERTAQTFADRPGRRGELRRRPGTRPPRYRIRFTDGVQAMVARETLQAGSLASHHVQLSECAVLFDAEAMATLRALPSGCNGQVDRYNRCRLNGVLHRVEVL